MKQCPGGRLRLLPTEIREVGDPGAGAAGRPRAQRTSDRFTSFGAHDLPPPSLSPSSPPWLLLSH